jgi:hypothetical protein
MFPGFLRTASRTYLSAFLPFPQLQVSLPIVIGYFWIREIATCALFFLTRSAEAC